MKHLICSSANMKYNTKPFQMTTKVAEIYIKSMYWTRRKTMSLGERL